MPKKLDLTGQIFGRLTAIRLAESTRKDKVGWLCRCICGKETIVWSASLRKRHTRSCGCLLEEWQEQHHRLLPGEAAFNSLYGGYKKAAQYKNRQFDISKEEFRLLTKMSCTYCGSEPFQVCTHGDAKTTPYIYMGMDRVDNKQGYTKDNVVPCCKACNIAKNAMSLDMFETWLDRLVKFRIKKIATQPESSADAEE